MIYKNDEIAKSMFDNDFSDIDSNFNSSYEDEKEFYNDDSDEDFEVSLRKSTMSKNSSENQDKTFYEIIYNTKLKEDEIPLGRVIGHETQKAEILNVIDWFKKSKELREKGVSIPKGVILFGDPGNGKSLLMKEIIRCAEAPVFIFKGEDSNITQSIIEIFNKARETGHAIIVIDELDLLIDKDRRVIRALQENLDGVESVDDILVLAATNDIDEIPNALMRNGRLEKLIKIPYPTGEEAIELLKKHFKEFKIELPDDFDDEEVALSLNGISCAAIKSIVNDIVLRNGFDNITVQMIDDSIYNITNRVKDTPEEQNLEIAIHEASHAVMAMAYPEYFTINKLNLNNDGGQFHSVEIGKGFWSYKKVIADIKISMAGLIAEKIICKSGSRGVESDLQEARSSAYNLFTQSGYSSCWETLPPPASRYSETRKESQIKLRRMERKIERFLRKCERETYRYVRKHSDKIKKLGNLLFEKKHLKSSEIMACIA